MLDSSRFCADSSSLREVIALMNEQIVGFFNMIYWNPKLKHD